MKPSNRVNTTRHVILHSVVLPFIHVESLDQAGWQGPNAMAFGLPEPESASTEAELYTDLQSAMVFAERMRQLIAFYQSLYGEFYSTPCNRN